MLSTLLDNPGDSSIIGLYLLVSRLESDISLVIAKIAISCTLNFPTIKFHIFCVVWATVGTFPHKFWYATVISAIMSLNMNCLWATYVDRNQRAFLAQMTSFVVWYDFIYHSFPISSQYLMMWGVDSPAIGQVRLKNYLPSQEIYSPHTNGVDFFQALRTMTLCRYLHVLDKWWIQIWSNYMKVSGKNFLKNLIVHTNIHYYSTMILYLPVHLLTNFH